MLKIISPDKFNILPLCMIIRQKIALEGVRFFAFHGFYPEEQQTGNDFVLDITAEMDVVNDGSDNLENTINYERLFDIAAAEMKITSKLIETVAHRILSKISLEFPEAMAIEVSIRKFRLPLQGEVQNSLVSLSYRK